ncbi:MAG TPA: hypothetical protein VGQ23_10570 [Burkholderiaceae bacterium]|jgi:isohexenylglutaconyl-CoA hydratase|nr:hypothetical protein [Burkholderiaceae bacterium]
MRSFDTLAVRRDGGVLHLTLNRPELRNAMSLAMVGELREALRDAEADASTRISHARRWRCSRCSKAR